MDWVYFDLVKTEEGFYLWDFEHEVPFLENGKLKYFASFDEAETYLVEQNIRASIRDIITQEA
jgi:hypothetical protein